MSPQETLGLGAAFVINALPIAAQDAATAVDAVERLGGWAVVVWIVWWLTRRWERVMNDHTKTIEHLITAIKENK